MIKKMIIFSMVIICCFSFKAYSQDFATGLAVGSSMCKQCDDCEDCTPYKNKNRELMKEIKNLQDNVLRLVEINRILRESK